MGGQLSQLRATGATAKGDIVERLVRQDRLIVLVAIAAIIVIAGFYTVMGVGMNMSALDMTRMAQPFGDRMNLGMDVYWAPAYGALVGLMWWIMMIAMMTPSAAPTLLLFTALKRRSKDRERTHIYSALFLAGYLLIWAFFAASAAILQWLLETTGFVSGSMMTISSKALAGTVFLGAGLYQFSGRKNACLKHCRSPAVFLAEPNSPGLAGALRMGAHHGVFCLGCCWALMALLFVGGVMNLYWITGLAVYVIVEKRVSNGERLSKIAGSLLVLAGGFYLFQAAT